MDFTNFIKEIDLNRVQLAERLDVSVQTIYNWEKEGLPVHRTQGIKKVRYDEKEVLEWLKGRSGK